MHQNSSVMHMCFVDHAFAKQYGVPAFIYAVQNNIFAYGVRFRRVPVSTHMHARPCVHAHTYASVSFSVSIRAANGWMISHLQGCPHPPTCCLSCNPSATCRRPSFPSSTTSKFCSPVLPQPPLSHETDQITGCSSPYAKLSAALIDSRTLNPEQSTCRSWCRTDVTSELYFTRMFLDVFVLPRQPYLRQPCWANDSPPPSGSPSAC